MYLALSGARLKGQDVYHAGIATHYVARDMLPALVDRCVTIASRR
jgi:enoyl-CoA hydratase/carnithine racemase